MKLINLNLDFLNENFEKWDQTESYISSNTIVIKLNAVYDPAERAVKMTSDFINSARDEDHFQNLLQVVEYDRKTKKNLRRKGTKSKIFACMLVR